MKRECPMCEGTGWRPIEKGGWRAVEVCPCQAELREREADTRARIPRRYRQCDFGSFTTVEGTQNNLSLQMALIKARGFVEQYPPEKGLLFLGAPGVGKTHLTVAILKELLTRKKIACLFCSFQDLLQQIRNSYNVISLSTEMEVLQPVLETEVVAIDDLGANRISDWVEDTVTYILNYRYNEKKLTLLTSNLPDTAEETQGRSPSGKYRIGDTLTDRIGRRVRSRLHEMCEVVRMDRKDFRQEVHAHGKGSF